MPAALTLFAIALACGGIGLAYEHDLVKDYAIWAPDLTEQAAVVQKTPGTSGASVVVGAMVFAYGWDDAYIIAKQHPNLDGFDEINAETTHWFIVDVATDEVYGPLTEAEYAEQREVLGVPDDLDFTHIVEP